jgi:hypothetical protein
MDWKYICLYRTSTMVCLAMQHKMLKTTLDRRETPDEQPLPIATRESDDDL